MPVNSTVDSSYLSADAIADITALTRALGDPTRLRIFLSLRNAERCVRDLVDSEGMSQSLVSHHLRVLVDAGLVQARRADGFHLYAVNPGGMTAARAALAEVLDADGLGPRARPGGNSGCCQ